MKLTTYAAAVLVTCVPSVALALVGVDWKFAKFPKDGVDDVTFPFNMANAPHKSGFYFAQEYTFHNVAKLAYCGVQPRPNDAKGKEIVHGVFSTFQGGSTSSHKNCHYGADSGPGVSCAVEIQGDYSHTYNVAIKNIGDTTWRGTLVDAVTGNATIIGEWTLPTGAGKISNGYMGFIEYYTWNGQESHTCASLPYAEASFFDPTSTTPGASGGSIVKAYEYGDCVGHAGYVATKVPGGYDIKVGVHI
ncbi:hypothetical protein BGZ83_008638 [Gryganskiella cystojenkinii]|nr:hypothetical protein BGZ83_008638 [Gryganskiella cystojenkinii]